MIQGTTPTHNFTLPFAASQIEALRIAYEQNGKIVLTKEKEDCELSGNKVTVKLTQAETIGFEAPGNVRIQLHIRTTEGKGLVSTPESVPNYILLDRREI